MRNDSSFVLGVVALLLLGGLGAAVYLMDSPETAERPLSVYGLNLPQAPAAVSAPAPPAPLEDRSVRPLSGLLGVAAGDLPLAHAPPKAPAPEPAAAPATAADRLTTAVRRYERLYDNLGRKYTARYPVIREYGREWMKFKDLKKCNDDYFKDRNPVKFAYNVANSPNFAYLVKKYSTRPEMRAYIKDAALNAPRDLTGAFVDYFKEDEKGLGLAKRFGGAIGVPPPVMSAFTGVPVDARAAAQEVLQGMPAAASKR